MTRIKGKAVLVTGSSRGIGLAVARAVAERGANVFICARNADEVSSVVSGLRKEFGGLVEGRACDVRKYDVVRSTIDAAVTALGGLDVLVNNAGIGRFANVESMPVEDWCATIETNLSGVFYFCREVIATMKRRGAGYIINVGSLAGKNAFPGGAAYNASKFGLIGFSEALMQEVRHDGIRVSYVMPGSVNTAFGRTGEEDPSKTWKLLPEDVADVIVSLLESDPRALSSRVEIRPSQPKS